jgi:hypothetical protein
MFSVEFLLGRILRSSGHMMGLDLPMWAARLALLLVSFSAFAEQTTGGVVWLDTLSYTKPQFYPLTVPTEASSPKYYVDMSSGSGTACTQASPCASVNDVAGKPGTNGGPAYIYLKGNGRLVLNGTLFGSSGNEIVIKPWPGETTVVNLNSLGNTATSGANQISGSGVRYIIIDGGENLLFSWNGACNSCSGNQNNYTLWIAANDITVARTRIHAGAGTGPALGIGTNAPQGNATNIRWVNNELYDSMNYYGVYTGGGAACSGQSGTTHTNLQFINNIFRNYCGRGIQIEPRAAGVNTYVLGNAFHDGGGGISCGVTISHAVEPAGACGGSINGIYVRNNLAFELGGGFGQIAGSNNFWENNTIYRYGKQTPVSQGSHGFTCEGGSNCTGTVRNNIIHTPVSGGIAALDPGKTPSPSNRNLCETACGTKSTTATAAATFQSTSSSSANYLKLISTSAGKDTGVDLSGSFTSSYSGVTRPKGSGYDVGAWEYWGPVTNFMFTP